MKPPKANTGFIKRTMQSYLDNIIARTNLKNTLILKVLKISLQIHPAPPTVVIMVTVHPHKRIPVKARK
jgi:hypothetical protein